MNTPLYRGVPTPGEERPPSPRPLPPSPTVEQICRETYEADPGLRDAVNVALYLRRPLLLTGKPGTGKTQLAYSLAWELGFPDDNPLKFETKSTSESRDLFYTYDSLARFHAARSENHGEDRRGIDYFTLNALGKAIVRAMPSEAVTDAFGEGAVQKLLGVPETAHQPAQSIVLIDEIDKAPRDFPNDILNEIEQFYFRVPELRVESVRAAESMRPVVVITSNSEKALPDAFLRRCIFYHIPFPSRDQLGRIMRARLTWLSQEESDPFLQGALDFFDELGAGGLSKTPSTAELLDWLIALRETAPEEENPLDLEVARLQGTLSCLAKFERDLKKTHDLFGSWKAGRTKR